MHEGVNVKSHFAGSLKKLAMHIKGAIEKGGFAPIAHLPALEELSLSGATCKPGELDSWPACSIASTLKSFSFQK